MRKITLITISLLIFTIPIFAADDIVHGGAIARSPALVVAATDDPDIGWPCWWTAAKAHDELKSLGYKIYDNKLISATLANKSRIHKGLEVSSVFAFSGHGTLGSITNRKNNPSWGLDSDNFTTSKSTHGQDPNRYVLVYPEQYRFVFLLACESARGSYWPDAFGIYGDRGKCFLGFKNEPEQISGKVFYKIDVNRIFWNANSNVHLDVARWYRAFWNNIGNKRTVLDSWQRASDSWKTSKVTSEYGLKKTGDLGLRLK